MFPVIIAPTPVPKEDLRDFLQVSLNRTKDDRTPIQIFEYTSLLVQVCLLDLAVRSGFAVPLFCNWLC